MLVKFESKSNRVKGLAFHPKRPWILSSLHNGVIQLWDYRMGTLLERFDEHDGPVRGIAFHPTQPLFVSGGDDYKIKVWNYKTRRCLFTLQGHLDYIRTVQFHHEQPWIVSSSDDQTIRIWNWQSRTCVAVLTGHNHYVMCASFHPTEDLIVSASLDQTVRVWDISALKKKSPGPSDNLMHVASLNSELFGGGEAMVKYILEGHDRGVNWVAFHPTMPLIVSGADDRTIKLWRMNETKAWEVDTLRGHVNNVSCVVFHPKQDIIISDSEDKTIRVWDLNKRTPLHTFRREHDRFWVLAVHPEQNLIAAGHDSGLQVFKLERERPAHSCYQNLMYYVKDKSLRSYDFAANRDGSVMPVRKGNGPNTAIRSMSLNPAEGLVLLQSDAEGGSFEMYSLRADGSGSPTDVKGFGVSAVFVARDKFAILDKTKQIVVKTIKNEVKKRIPAPVPSVDCLFQASSGTVLMRADDRIYMYDFQQKKITAEVAASGVKYAIWSLDGKKLALVSKHSVVLCNQRLEAMCTIHETIRVKSGAFDDAGVFIYTTLNHMKYCLPNGDHGIIKTLDVPLYITRVKSNAIHFLDREGRVSLTYVDATEYRFKLALLQRKYDEILKIVKDSKMLGQSIIAYLQQKGYPEVAMHFVKDDLTRFNLALECGNLEVAQETATRLGDNKDCWSRLAQEALRQGNHQIVEMCYQRTKDFERLSFLYLITGNLDKLRRMLNIAEMRGDVMGRFHNSLYLGDAAERTRILSEVGQNNLAYITAKTYGLDEQVSQIADKISSSAEGAQVPDYEPSARSRPMTTPQPIMCEANWPLLTVSKSFLEGALADKSGGEFAVESLESGGAAASGWGDESGLDLDGLDGEGPSDAAAAAAISSGPKEESVWEGMDSLDIPDLGPSSSSVSSSSSSARDPNFFVTPNPGVPVAQRWAENSSQLAADQAASGSFDSAMQILHRTVGVVNFAPLKPFFLSLYQGSHASLPGLPLAPALLQPLSRTFGDERTPHRLPSLATAPGLAPLVEKLKVAYKSTTDGKFVEAQAQFLHIIHALLFVVVETKAEVAEVKELLNICREYVSAIRIELSRREMASSAAPDAAQRQAELAAYFTHFNLQPVHLMLSLRQALLVNYKIKNYASAASFARRLLEMNPNAEVATQAKKVVQFAEQNNRNEFQLRYDERNPFVVCGHSHVPIYRGSETVRCPCCFAPYLPEHKGKTCAICQVSQIGKDTIGMVCSTSQLR